MRGIKVWAMVSGLVLSGMWLLASNRQTVSANQGDAVDASLVEADHAFLQAVVKNDKAALGKLLGAGFTWTTAEGGTSSKERVLQRIPKPAIASETAATSKIYAYGALADVQINLGRAHVLRVWTKTPAGWKAIVYQEVMSLDAAPTATPGAGKDCENPCKGTPFQPKDKTEKEVISSYSKLETAALARNSAVFATFVADEFAAASSNSNKIYGKKSRMDDFDHSKTGGMAPTPLTTARMLEFGDAVLMISEHIPDHGAPLHVTRLWVKRSGNWVSTLSYQTSIRKATTAQGD